MFSPPDKALAFCALLVLLITTTSSIKTAAADGNVGCLFSRSLCTQDIEWCFDDFAFGRCLQSNVEDEELYRYEFSKDQLQELERQMTQLFSRHYRWSHAYTQCILQAILYAFKIGSEFDDTVCDNLKDQDLDTALKAIESDTELQLDPHNMAYVKFTPSVGNPQTDYADEVYYPPLTPEEEEELIREEEARERERQKQREEEEREREEEEEEADTEEQPYIQRFLPQAKLLADDTPSLQDVEAVFPDLSGADGYHNSKQFPFTLVRKKDAPTRRSSHFNEYYNDPEFFRVGLETRDMNIPPLVQGLRTFSNSYNSPESFRNGVEVRDKLYPARSDDDDDGYEERAFTDSVLFPALSREYNTPDRFRHGVEMKDTNSDSAPHSHHRTGKPPPPRTEQQHEAKLLFERLTDKLIIDDVQGEGGGDAEAEESEKEKSQLNRAYTEGGLVILPPKQSDVEESLSDLLGGLEPGLDNAFKRPERLDVKKPGPLFRINNYAFQGENKSKPHASVPAGDDNEEDGAGDGENDAPYSKSQSDHDNDVEKHSTQRDTSRTQPSQQDESKPSALKVEKKMAALTETAAEDETSDQYDVVDTSIAYIGFKDSIRKWDEGRKIADAVAQLLHLPASTFTNIRVDRNEVTFKVQQPNSRGLNASQVANKIESIKDQLRQKTGVTVTSAGIGDKTKLPTVLSLGGDSDHELYVATFIVCGVMGAILLSAAALFVIRRYAASRAKLQNLTAPDTEASKDYQELCRARMAAKPPQEGPQMTSATGAASQRIASLSRESDNSPSSRSSTSSWSEEPALSSMDISTGHMVLSYMEDHLRNKDRLETEWAALCAYEADPCATTIAQRPENAKKNRYVNALPYDHARVVLNELSNLTGSDYINASTITDHDPRNPAYIATQGPLPNTAPDLWQMVWEQGCVVIVMLTRLIENEVAMCHRYWPEEGSELYHIYEVHLVSEHIWCDDYLVRSFYLKNLKTGETRTVTQFHFLSWPDGGVPTSTKALLEFRRKVNKSFRGRSCPIVVHCSDGVGRTGTYCLLDMVLNRMAKGAKEIDIAATLEHIRDQRGGSVATKQQFQLVLAAVAEEVQAILRILPQQQQPPTTTASAQ